MRYVLCIVLLCSTSFYAAECGKGEKRKDQTQEIETTESATSKRFKPTLASPTLIAAPQGAEPPPTSSAYILLQKQFLEIMGKVLNTIEQYDQRVTALEALERKKVADSADIQIKLAAQIDINAINYANMRLLMSEHIRSISNLQARIEVLEKQHKDLVEQTAKQLADHGNKLEEHQKTLGSHALAHRIHDDREEALNLSINRSVDERKTAPSQQDHVAHALKGDDEALPLSLESSLPEQFS
jgi:hypothetical protein